MEVFVKIIAEDLKSGKRKMAATALLTFVALDELRRPTRVPQVTPESDEEKKLHETAPERARMRKERKQRSKELAAFLTTNQPWDLHPHIM
jgi:acyl-CoA hydrolase